MTLENDGHPSEPIESSLRVRATRGTLISVGGQAAGTAIRLASNLALTRLLFPDAFGTMAVIQLLVTAIEQVTNVGTAAAIMNNPRGDEREFLDTAWTIHVIRGVGIWIVASALSPLAASYFRQPELLTLIPVASFSATLGGFMSTKLILMTRRLELSGVVAIELAAQVVSLLATALLAWWYKSVWALVAGGLASQLATVLLSQFWLTGYVNRFTWNRHYAKEVFAIGRWVVASSGLSFLLAQLDLMLLGRLVSPAELGLFSIGSNIPLMVRDLAFRLGTSVVVPILAEAHREGTEAARASYANVRMLTLPLASLAGLGVFISTPAFFGYLYDARYADAGWIAQLAVLRFWGAFLQTSACLALLSFGDAQAWAISNLVGLVGAFAGALLGFHAAGLAGLMIGTAAGSIASAAVPLARLWRSGIGSPAAELFYSMLGITLAAAATLAAQLAGEVWPVRWELRLLVVGGGVTLPYGVWVLVRVLRSMKLT